MQWGTGPGLTPRTTTANATMAAQSVTLAGGSEPHDNMQPFQCVSFIIALEGIFPSRS